MHTKRLINKIQVLKQIKFLIQNTHYRVEAFKTCLLFLRKYFYYSYDNILSLHNTRNEKKKISHATKKIIETHNQCMRTRIKIDRSRDSLVTH